MSGMFPTPPLPYSDDKARYDPADAIPHLLATQEAKADISKVIAFLESFMTITTVLPEGDEVEILVRNVGRRGVDRGAWSLVGAGDDKFGVRPGKIYLDYGDLGNPAEIENADITFSVDKEGWVWIELDISDPEKPAFELKYGSKWDWHPNFYEEKGSPATVRKAVFPVWEFRASEEATHASESIVADGWIGERFIHSPHAMVTWGIHRSLTADERNDQTFAPILVPLA